MIQEKVVISDANILFDLLSVNLMDGFFALPFEVFTTDMVMHEVKTMEWKTRLETESRKHRMSIVDFTFEELCEISDLSQQRGAGGLSLPDCSVLYLAEQRKGRLLTGDKHLRFFAESLGVPVSGILYLFDCLVDKGILSPKEASEKLECLQQINPRLPAVECMDRISVWRGTEQQ